MIVFVFSSTCATYGEQDGDLDENCIQTPVTYGASKLAVENVLANYHECFELDYVIFRYFNVAGADPEAEIGEFHEPETHLIPRILSSLDQNKMSVTIYGTDYNTPDGTCVRDYVHVCDLVDAHILGLKYLLLGGRSRDFNLGTGGGYSVREVIDQVSKVTNRNIDIVEGSRRLGDCARLVSGSSRAIKELGWSAERSVLTEVIEDAWRWHQCGNFKDWKY